ncbi:non-ribosomal peptide synthetase [Amycolatopsis vancoresmycina]|uniref:non-ribosomal peptide synthetase n=2 Tax=Amycolatopsis vancoresmycina TaxID=208444 RepID=UPI000A4FD8D4|nr:non-ribosomal peptide synthetase [Amycolatopsis vancoresmycina]
MAAPHQTDDRVRQPGSSGTPVPELIARFARAHPGRAAVLSGGHRAGYRELDAWAGRIAARLAAAGAGRGSRVAVLAEPSTAMVAAAFGVLRAGAAYVPLDQAQPDGRIAAVLADARVTAAVVTGETVDRLAGSGLPVIRADEAAEGSERPLPPVPVTADDPAYLIYTSGSTGEPKGVLVEHGQLAASTEARHAVYPGAPVFLLVSPLAFDSSVAGLWGTLTAGGSVVVARPDEVRDPVRLLELIERHGVTRLLCVPSLYRVLLDASARLGGRGMSTLDTVIVAGEPLPQALVDRHFAVHAGAVALVNEYGPTEATVWASYRRFDAPGPVSIGGPVPGARLYVLDDRRQPVPDGTQGELYIGGRGVARGYFGRPDATAAVFVEDPFAEGARMYRTGDIVRRDADGQLEFLGRRDHQVKIRGHRVELGAVEAALRTVPGIDDAVVVAAGDPPALTAFVIAAAAIDTNAVRAALTARLPAAAVPGRIRPLDRLPQTVTGKIDRNALQAMAETTQSAAVPAATAAGDTVGKVAAAWAEVLELPEVPAEVNFFDLGGHSLTMFQLQEALERRTGIRPSVVQLFRHTTVSEQAALIRDTGAQDGRSRSDARQAAARRASAVRARRQRVGGGAGK